MIISLIAAVTENNVIGKGGTMPWHLPEDLKYFKQTTSGHTVIMGRKTWESLGKYAPLPNRRNIVLTRSGISPPPVGGDQGEGYKNPPHLTSPTRGEEKKSPEIFTNLQSALAACKNNPSIHPALIPSSEAYRGTKGGVTQDEDTEIFIIGGGQVYKEAIAQANRLYLTRIHAAIDGDTFFPNIPADFKLVKATTGQTADPKLTFEVWEKP